MSNISIWTRSRDMCLDMRNLIELTEVMATDLSKLIGVSPEDIIADYVDELEFDIAHQAFNDVLREHGTEIPDTFTRIIINRLERKLKDERNSIADTRRV